MPATTATSASYAGVNGHTYYFRSRARDNAFNLEAWPADYDAVTTVDAVPPASSVNAAAGPIAGDFHGQLERQRRRWAPASRTMTSRLRMGLVEAGQIGSLQLPTLRLPTLASTGHTYYFRCRARDNVSNLEAWPADYDAVTIVDAVPPVSSMTPLTKYSYVPDRNLTVSWTWHDPGGRES